MNADAFKVTGTRTGRMTLDGRIPKGNEPMTLSEEFKRAIRTTVIKTDLGAVERKLAEELCQKQDTALLEKLASP